MAKKLELSSKNDLKKRFLDSFKVEKVAEETEKEEFGFLDTDFPMADGRRSRLFVNDKEKDAYSTYMQTIVQGANVKNPVLRDMSKSSIRNFIQQYRIQIPFQLIRKPQAFTRHEIMKAVATQNDCTINALLDLPAVDFLNCLCKIYASMYPNETEARLKSIQMASDDLAAETLLKFNEDWDFELMCCTDYQKSA